MIKNFLIKLVLFYKKHLQPTFFRNTHCKYRPTCSEYMIESLEKKGAFKGLLSGIWRILRCNPFSKGGYDPVK